MIQITVDFNPQDLVKQIGLLDFKLQKNLNKAVQAAALLVQATAKTSIQRGSRTGRVYNRRGIRHQASGPGEYPKSDTGRLASSIRTDFAPFQASIGSDLNYSQFLETGTSRMAARPWLGRSLEANNERIRAIIDEAMRDTI